MSMGMMVTINQQIDAATAEIIAAMSMAAR
jgi:hypothetical protein